MENQVKTWLITGGSQGIGLSLVKQLLQEGHKVAVTGRDLQTIKNAIGEPSAHFLPLQIELTDEASIAKAVNATIAQFKSIDVLVNNAGYGLIGGIEETDAKEVQAIFDVNVFGLLNITRAVLPHMRAAGAGHIFNLSTVFGLIAGASWGLYCGTKFAVEGLSEALAQELKPFGIQVTIIEPGYVRTNFLQKGSIAHPKNPIAAYTAIQEEKRKHSEEIPGNQIGDPEKIAAVIINASQSKEPPLRLLLGSDSLQFANYKLQQLRESIDANEAITLSTDFQ